MAYLFPSALPEAFSGLARPGAQVIAGGTDWFPARGEKLADGPLLDITGLPGFRGISRDAAGWRIGAATTWTDLLRADLPGAFGALQMAAREIGSVQIQNVGTIAGNLCNASPAADGVPPLLIVDAQVELVSANGTRNLPLDAFLLGPRRTAIGPGELVSAILIPSPPPAAQSAFIKAGARKYLVISIAMLAALIETDRGRITHIRLAAGACGPVARRLYTAEALLTGARIGQLPPIAAADLGELAPIDDHRATAAYRISAVAALIPRVINGLAGSA